MPRLTTWRNGESNPGPSGCEPDALPAELHPHVRVRYSIFPVVQSGSRCPPGQLPPLLVATFRDGTCQVVSGVPSRSRTTRSHRHDVPLACRPRSTGLIYVSPGLSCPKWSLRELNPRPSPCHGVALPTELRPQSVDRDRRPVLFHVGRIRVKALSWDLPRHHSRTAVAINLLPSPPGRLAPDANGGAAARTRTEDQTAARAGYRVIPRCSCSIFHRAACGGLASRR